MNIQDELKALSDANRLVELEIRASGVSIPGDFAGNVTGSWVGLGESGEGIVTYNNKRYVTKPLGRASIPAGTEVELSFANGVYYSNF